MAIEEEPPAGREVELTPQASARVSPLAWLSQRSPTGTEEGPPTSALVAREESVGGELPARGGAKVRRRVANSA